MSKLTAETIQEIRSRDAAGHYKPFKVATLLLGHIDALEAELAEMRERYESPDLEDYSNLMRFAPRSVDCQAWNDHFAEILATPTPEPPASVTAEPGEDAGQCAACGGQGAVNSLSEPTTMWHGVKCPDCHGTGKQQTMTATVCRCEQPCQCGVVYGGTGKSGGGHDG